MKGVMRDQYIVYWNRLVRLITTALNWSKIMVFIAKYILLSTVHTIWRERNRRRHGEAPCPATLLIRKIDKNMRNRFTVIKRRGDKSYEGGMAIWFGRRHS